VRVEIEGKVRITCDIKKGDVISGRAIKSDCPKSAVHVVVADKPIFLCLEHGRLVKNQYPTLEAWNVC
jgi:hypothetical protein